MSERGIQMFSFKRSFAAVVAGLAVALIGQHFHSVFATIWSSWRLVG